ncbi:hypothetical protein [Myroides odoratus]|uniref:hypothetical protein n=1 Tax=Myroides odoratus TaxID=256 RepID=UPI0033428C2F
MIHKKLSELTLRFAYALKEKRQSKIKVLAKGTWISSNGLNTGIAIINHAPILTTNKMVIYSLTKADPAQSPASHIESASHYVVSESANKIQIHYSNLLISNSLGEKVQIDWMIVQH